jgi:hypothetical protein
VRRRERFPNPQHDLDRPLSAHPLLQHRLAQIAPREQLHHDEVPPVVFPMLLQHAHDGIVLKPRHRPRPAEEALPPPRVAGDLGVKHLDRDAAPLRRIGGFPDGGKPALANPPLQQVAAIAQRIPWTDLPARAQLAAQAQDLLIDLRHRRPRFQQPRAPRLRRRELLGDGTPHRVGLLGRGARRRLCVEQARCDRREPRVAGILLARRAHEIQRPPFGLGLPDELEYAIGELALPGDDVEIQLAPEAQHPAQIVQRGKRRAERVRQLLVFFPRQLPHREANISHSPPGVRSLPVAVLLARYRCLQISPRSASLKSAPANEAILPFSVTFA